MFSQIYLGNSLVEYVSVVIMVLVGILFKNVITRVVLFILKRSFKSLSSEEKAGFESFLLKPISVFIMLLVFYIAISILRYPLDVVIFHRSSVVNSKTVSEVVTIRNIIDLVLSLLIWVAFFRIILRVIDMITYVYVSKSRHSNDKREEQLTVFIKETSKALVVIIAFFVIISEVFKVNIITLITGLGIGGIAIALAAKDSLENLFGSFTIFLDKPFVVGDYIKVDGVEGVVEKVGFRSTWIRSVDKTLVVLPNRNMIDGNLENLTERTYRRVRFYVGLLYETSNDNIVKIVDEIRELLDHHPQVEPGCSVSFENFNSSSIDVLVLYLCKELDSNKYLAIRQDINLQIVDIVNRAGSGFAYPTQRSIEEHVSVAANEPQS